MWEDEIFRCRLDMRLRRKIRKYRGDEVGQAWKGDPLKLCRVSRRMVNSQPISHDYNPIRDGLGSGCCDRPWINGGVKIQIEYGRFSQVAARDSWPAILLSGLRYFSGIANHIICVRNSPSIRRAFYSRRVSGNLGGYGPAESAFASLFNLLWPARDMHFERAPVADELMLIV